MLFQLNVSKKNCISEISYIYISYTLIYEYMSIIQYFSISLKDKIEID